MKSFIFFSFQLLSIFSYAQCPSGTLGVTGAGCGCISGCDLTSMGGPNCSPSVNGNCTSGQTSMSVTIVVPDGCTYTVTAIMQNRSTACSASGADSGDGIKVDIPSGPKPFQTGTGNASLSDSYTLTGPGTIEVSGTANRADEIITYTTTFSGATCVNCMSVLPVGATNFKVNQENKSVACSWTTESEHNNHYFTIEKSVDGVHFETVGHLPGLIQSTTQKQYKLYDNSPTFNAISYYRLSQTDLDGKNRILGIESIYLEQSESLNLFPNPSSGFINITGELEVIQTIEIMDNIGRNIPVNIPLESNSITLSGLSQGVYTIRYIQKNMPKTKQFIVAH